MSDLIEIPYAMAVAADQHRRLAGTAGEYCTRCQTAWPCDFMQAWDVLISAGARVAARTLEEEISLRLAHMAGRSQPTNDDTEPAHMIVTEVLKARIEELPHLVAEESVERVVGGEPSASTVIGTRSFSAVKHNDLMAMLGIES